ncbi:MAG TPA: energy transducer TonB [Rhodocyclaceae bacterium]|jgi:protein TonB|nr:energy transducer TonB [Rhodocyclaceae bacterium]
MTIRLSSRLLLALTGSVLLHMLLLAGKLPTVTTPQAVRLDVTLAVPQPVVTDPSVLEKNTISQQDKAEPPAAPPSAQEPPAQIRSAAKTPAPLPPKQAKRLNTKHEAKVMRKVVAYLVYPKAAVEAGMEGTVHVLIKLDAHGNIQQASVAASSGHIELDHAAINAILQAGSLDTGGQTDVILPLIFRLQ